MENESNGDDIRIQRLKTVKSAYIIEADALMAQGMEAAAMGLFVKAAELELELADFFASRSKDANDIDTRISRFSAASCLFRAKQFRRAAVLFQQMVTEFPEARKLIAECDGKDDVALTGRTPGLQALIDLLVKKNIINEMEWAETVGAR